MEQHPIPRQITSFEFKLIGFMTLRQFLYLVIFFPIGFIVYFLFPIPFLNLLLGVLIGGVGLAFAFVPIYDRPLEIWVKNFYKRLISPTQYFYKKNNPPIYFLTDLYFVEDPHRILAHVESKEKLEKYLKTQQQKKSDLTQNGRKQQINNLLGQKTIFKSKPQISQDQPLKKTENLMSSPPKKPFLSGVVKNHHHIPLPGILIYIKDEKNNPVRILKTNPHGVFATFSPLPDGDYFFESIDSNHNYIFDKIKITIKGRLEKPIEIFSKELI